MSDIYSPWRPALVAGTLLLSAAAYAQAIEAGPAPAAPSRPMPPPPGARVEADITYLKTALSPTAAQMPLWDQVADVLRATAKRRDDAMHFRQIAQEKNGNSTQIAVNRNLIDGLVAIQRQQSAESDDLSALLTVLKPFYATLTDQQKIIADEMIRPGPGGPHEFGPVGMGLPMMKHGPMGQMPFERDCRPEFAQ